MTPREPELVGAEPVSSAEAATLAHLGEHRRLIVRRSLLATTLGGLVPLPVVDDYVAGRVRAWLLLTLAERRRVDLASSSAELLADPRDGTALRNATLTAATLLALKLTWRKFFALLAAGRRADDMATSFQTATLFDHYCARLHVGPGIDRPRAFRLRGAIHGAVAASHREALVAVFREGGKVLGRSLLEAPSWVSRQAVDLGERWARSAGHPAAAGAPAFDPAPLDADDMRWIDRATAAVEERLGCLGHRYLAALVADFERRWQSAERVGDAAGGAGPAGASRV